jgi:hypothetical protein
MHAAKRRSVVLAWLAAIGLLGVAAQTGWAAFTGHEYSTALEKTGGVFNGVRSNWKDLNVNPPCGTAVYQSVWVGLDNGAQDWEELGTGDACFGNDFIYWGYGIGGVWHQLGTASTPGGTATHEFKIARDLVGDWNYYVDGVKKGSDHWDAGIKLITGLESYADLTIGAQVFSPLWYQKTAGGSWFTWTGKDATIVDANMCGRWNSASDWRAAEHAAC